MRVRDQRVLAQHEAAHAVAARRLGLSVSVVSLRPPKGYAGWCWVTAQNMASRSRPLLVLTLAGPWAEGRFLHLRGDVLPLGSDSDLAAAVRLSHELGGEHWRRVLLDGFHDTAALLGEPGVAAEVSAVARALRTRPVLHGAELDELCARVRS